MGTCSSNERLYFGNISCFLKLNNCFARFGFAQCGCTAYASSTLNRSRTTCAQIINYRENMLFRHKYTSLAYINFWNKFNLEKKNEGCWSLSYWYGSGSADPCLWLMNPDPVPAIFVIDLQDGNKKLIFSTDPDPAIHFLRVIADPTSPPWYKKKFHNACLMKATLLFQNCLETLYLSIIWQGRIKVAWSGGPGAQVRQAQMFK